MGALQSIKSINSNSSKGILPALNRYPSPTVLEPFDHEQEKRIKEQLDYNRFQGYDIKKRSLANGIHRQKIDMQ